MRIVLQAFSFLEKNGYYSMSLPFLKSALLSSLGERNELDIRIVQSDFFADLDEVQREIDSHDPDLVGFSVFVWSVDLTARLAKMLAAKPKKPIIVCGGKGLNGCTPEFMSANPAVDVVVRHDGELTFVELVRHTLDEPSRPRELAAISGITYRDEDDRIQENGDRTERMLLSEIPSPYLEGHFRPRQAFNHETERYCPNYCNYCTWRHYNKRAADNQISLDTLGREFKWAWDAGLRDFRIWDAATNYDTDRFIGILDAFDAASGSDEHQFALLTHDRWVDARQLEAIATFKKRLHVNLSVESFSPEALRICNRPNNIDNVKALATQIAAKASGPHVMVLVNFMLGLPGDDLATFAKALEFFRKVPNVHITVSPLVVPPGTVFRKKEKEYGFVYKEGAPFVSETRSFRPEDFRTAFDMIQRVANDSARSLGATLNPLFVPLRRLSNPSVVPEARRRQMKEDDWLFVGVVGIKDGFVEAGNVYRDMNLLY